mmetsp:Transcript_2460/g.5723  ORF Transcript_2460/g.5723 Transcript_2460/m.5723 type:complete len:240 (-) Transcript_2460:583-1302(-)
MQIGPHRRRRNSSTVSMRPCAASPHHQSSIRSGSKNLEQALAPQAATTMLDRSTTMLAVPSRRRAFVSSSSPRCQRRISLEARTRLHHLSPHSPVARRPRRGPRRRPRAKEVPPRTRWLFGGSAFSRAWRTTISPARQQAVRIFDSAEAPRQRRPARPLCLPQVTMEVLRDTRRRRVAVAAAVAVLHLLRLRSPLLRLRTTKRRTNSHPNFPSTHRKRCAETVQGVQLRSPANRFGFRQ